MNSAVPFLADTSAMKVWRLIGLLIASLCAVSLADPGPVRVALYDDGGSAGKGVPRVQEILGVAPGFQVTTINALQIQSGVLKDFEVVVFTGGSASKQAGTIGEKGRSEVKEFVERGGGYVGICAGAYLACEGFSWGLKILDAKTASPKWRRGAGDVKVELTSSGRDILGDRAREFDVRYVNGPILVPAGTELPDYQPLALFRTELAENETPKGVMINSPALAASSCGKGRVVVSSPHPEQTAGLDDLVVQAVRWAAQRDD